MFILTWVGALLLWRYGQIEEKWTARVQPATDGGTVHERAATVDGEREERPARLPETETETPPAPRGALPTVRGPGRVARAFADQAHGRG
jgi:hypothetical protein